MSAIIAIGQVEAFYFSKSFKPDDADGLIPAGMIEYLKYEYIPEGKGDSIQWDITGIVDDYFPASFDDMVDPDWEDEGEFVYNEVLKRVPTHPRLEHIEGSITPRNTKVYDPPESFEHPLLVRFPVIIRAEFSHDKYTGETDCWYEIRGIPDLYHLEDLLPKEEKPEE